DGSIGPPVVVIVGQPNDIASSQINPTRSLYLQEKRLDGIVNPGNDGRLAAGRCGNVGTGIVRYDPLPLQLATNAFAGQFGVDRTQVNGEQVAGCFVEWPLVVAPLLSGTPDLGFVVAGNGVAGRLAVSAQQPPR